MSDNNNTETKRYQSHKDRPNEENILEPFHYIIGLKGKGIREKFSRGFNEWFRIPDNLFKILLEIGNMGHNASLLIDDIEDGSDLRRGKPAAHVVYGMAKTINSANYVYFLQQEKIANEFPPEYQERALEIIIDQMLEGHIGQGMDIYWRENWICPTEKEYKKMVIQKTGAFFTASLQLGYLLSPNKERVKKVGKKLSRLGQVMAIFFQIRDDYANLVSKAYAERKSFAEDITEGKFSFPVIHCIHSNPKDKRLLDILKMKTTDPQLKREAIRIMEESGSLEYTRKTCECLDKEFRDLVNEIREIFGCGGDILLETSESYSLRNINTELEPKSEDRTEVSQAEVNGDCRTPAMAVIREGDKNNRKRIGGNYSRINKSEAKRCRSHKKRPNEKIILEPFYYMMASMGKSTRGDFLLRYSNKIGIPVKLSKEILCVTDMGQNACLMLDCIDQRPRDEILIDDIEDGSEQRRGQPCTHLVYGIPATLNAANYVYFLIQEKIIKVFPRENRLRALKVFIDRILQAHIGQGIEIHYRENMICPTEEQYKQMVIDKNSASHIAVGVGFLFNEDKELENKIGNVISRMLDAAAVVFQIRDDYGNLVSKAYEKAKTFADDITEGKFSFPITHCINSNSKDKSRLLEILKLRTTDLELKREAVRIIEESGSLEYTRKTHQALDEQFRRLVDEAYNVYLEHLLTRTSVKKEAQIREKALLMNEATHEIFDAYKMENINTDREPKGYIMQGPLSPEAMTLQTKVDINTLSVPSGFSFRSIHTQG